MNARVLAGTVVGALVAATQAWAAPAAPFTTDPIPGFTVDTYVLVVNTGKVETRHVLGAYQRFATSSSDSSIPRIVSRDRQRITGAKGRTPGTVVRNPYIAEPDGIVVPDDIGLRLARFVVTEARSGRITLTATRIGGRDVLRATIPLAANPCQKLAAGTATLWLTRSTLLPKRLDVTRDGKTSVSTYTYASFNQSVPRRVASAPPLGRKPTTLNERFVRRNPVAAAARLPFAPRLPTRLPAGFTLAQSGWAPFGVRTGRQLLNKPDRWLFSAVYRRGWERIEVTQRVATRTWRTDPFQRTCQILRGGRTSVGSLGARYGIGPDITSHIWYRDGNQLITVSGPYGKSDLATIARSLTRIP